MSESVRPHRRQPTRLHRPWNSPGKNTGVGCHFLLQCMKGKSESEVAQPCPTLCDPMDCCSPGSSVHGILQARTLEWITTAFSTSPLDRFQFPGQSLTLYRVPGTSVRLQSPQWPQLEFRSDQISRSVVSHSLRPHESQHARPPCPSPTPRVHWDSRPWSRDAIQPSHPLSSPSPLAPNPSQHQGPFK